jgi:ParB/RepB/Spo0J family partition protein
MTPAPTPLLLRIPLAKIHPSPDNPRKHFDAAFLGELGRSLRESGQFTPCIVRLHPKKTGEYELAAGESRLRAARLEKLETLDCFVKPLDDAQFLELLTFENLKRRDLQPMEEARGYGLLQKRLEGWTAERIAKQGGVSVDYVRDRLRLLRLSAAAVKLLEDHEIELGHALELAKLGEKDQGRAIKDGLFRATGRGQHSELLDLEKQPSRAVVTVTELRAWIDREVLADLAHPDLPDLYPETAKLLDRAKAEKLPQVFIATGYVQPHVKKGVEVLTPANWQRADGQDGSKHCDRPKKIGVVAAGDAARSHAFVICTSKACAVHFPDAVRRAKQRAKGEAKAVAKGKKVDSYAEQERKRREAQAKEDAARKARDAAMKAALPELQKAVVAAVAKLPVAPILEAAIADAIRDTWNVSKAERALVTGFKAPGLEGLVRKLALARLVGVDEIFNQYRWQHALPKACKAFGIDLDAILKKHAPAPKPSGPACVHCGCTETTPCILEGVDEDEACSWISKKPPVCSNPKCVAAQQKTATAATPAPAKPAVR